MCAIYRGPSAECAGPPEDAQVGFLLPARTESKKRKAIKTGKFYFFDPALHTCWPARRHWIATPIFTEKVLRNLSGWNSVDILELWAQKNSP
jgi:hypothetical protein